MASNDPGGWNPDKFLKIFQDAVTSYEKEHPHWRAEVLVSLIGRGLLGLKRRMEDPRKSKLTWDDAFTELHYPVDWDWTDKSVLDKAPVSGKLTPKNTADPETTRKTVNDMMVQHLNLLVLQELTHHLWLEKRKGQPSLNTIIPAALHETLSAAKNPSERQKLLEEFAHPFSIGAALIDYGDQKLKHGVPVPHSALKQLENIDKLIDFPPIGFRGTVGNHKIDISLVFLIHPLTIDYERRKAYHSFTVGLFVVPEVVDDKIISSTPANWSASDQQALWQELFREVAKLTDLFIPKAESQTSVILSLNAEIEIPAASVSEVRTKILDAVQKFGVTKKISMEEINSGEQAVLGISAKPHGDAEKPKNGNPWISGSFYFVVFMVIVTSLAAAAKILSIWVLPILILGGLLSVSIIGAFQLRNDGKISAKEFLKLMELALHKTPLLGKLLRKVL